MEANFIGMNRSLRKLQDLHDSELAWVSVKEFVNDIKTAPKLKDVIAGQQKEIVDKLLNRKEIGILMKPLLTKFFLKSKDKRDKLHMYFITEVPHDIKNYLHNQYKSYRNI